MAQYKSPGLEARERFIGGSVRNRPSGRAGCVGAFEWGPVNTITTISNPNELAEVFGEPNDVNYNEYFNASNYLNYANDLRIVRVINTESARNSTGLFDQLDYQIANEGTGYEVGDKILVLHNGSIIEEEGTVTEVGTEGQILKVYIPTRKIINQLKATDTYPTIDGTWEAKVFDGSAGFGALFDLTGLVQDSKVVVANSDFAMNALSETSFAEASSKYDIPRLSALYTGKKGDTITVEIVSYERFNQEQRGELVNYPYGNKRPMYSKDYFRYGPSNENQYAVLVFVNGTKVEEHIVSTDPKDADKLSGRSIYMDSYFDVGTSQYIIMSAKGFPTNFSGIITLGGGNSSSEDITAGDYITGLDVFKDDETSRINTLFVGGVANKEEDLATTVMKYASNIGEVNQNLVVIVDPLVSDVVDKIPRVAVENMVKRRGAESENNLNINSTYTVITGNWALQYDRFNNVNRWVSLSGDLAGLMAQCDSRSNPSQSPAGTEYGVIVNKLKLAINPNKTLRDQLTTVSINPVVTFGEGSGFMFYADLTASYEQTHYDHINNRRVSNYIKELFLDMGEGVLFKNNTEYTRLQFKTTGDGLLKGLSGNTIEFGRVWCDSRNNTTAVEFRKEFVASIYYKPYNSINYVLLNFVSVESGNQIEEDIVRSDQLPNF